MTTEIDGWGQRTVSNGSTVKAGKRMTEMDDRAEMNVAGRQRIAEFVHAAMGWAGQNASKKYASTGRISKATIDRVKRGETVSDTFLRALGDVLGLPRDFLLYIGYGEVDRIERLAESDSDPDRRDLIRWTLEHLFPNNPGHTRVRPA